MSNSSISDSKSGAPRRRFRWVRDILWVLLVLLALEGIVRIPPVTTYLSERLDSYENLLRFNMGMLNLQETFEKSPPFDGWLVGSSPMMTGVDPRLVEQSLNQGIDPPQRIQNAGIALLTNLEGFVMPLERMYLPVSQPDYVVVYTLVHNFSEQVLTGYRAGTYEQIFWHPNSVDDHIARTLYNNVYLYRYLLLSRNAFTVPVEETLPRVDPKGAFFTYQQALDCSEDIGIFGFTFTPETMAQGLQRLDALLTFLQNQGYPVMVINLPMPDCTIRTQFADYVDYTEQYLTPLNNHISAQGINFVALDDAFFATIPTDEHAAYFDDFSHANIYGAELFSAWSGEAIRAWQAEQQN